MKRSWVPTVLVVFGLAAAGAPAPASAQEIVGHPMRKLGRGVVNVLTGWIEVPKQLHIGAQEAQPLPGLAWGLMKGAGMFLLRETVGVYETVTFPLPYPRAYASPYEHMELPDYAWDE